MDRLQAIQDQLLERHRAMSTTARAILWSWAVLQLVVIAAFIIVTPSRIFETLAEWATELRDSRGGFLLLFVLINVTSFPPLFGYSTAITLCGFAFGLGRGFLLALAGTVSGAMASFALARLAFSGYAKRMLEDQPTFRALGNAVQHKGLPLICLIRLCPLPYSYSNFFFASIPTVSALQFFLATCALAPKLFLAVFIGNRLFLFSDPDQRDRMDRTSKVLNSFSVALAVLLGLGVGTYVYRLVMRFVAEDIAQGEVALLEDDLENFLDEEERVDARELGGGIAAAEDTPAYGDDEGEESSASDTEVQVLR